MIPGRHVARHVVDGHLNFTDDATQRTGTDITSAMATSLRSLINDGPGQPNPKEDHAS